MKKLLALSLCFMILFSFAACKEDEKKANDEIDLQYYVNLGQIPELEYKIGADCDEVNQKLSDEYEKYLSSAPHSTEDDDHYAEDIYFNVLEKDGYVFLDQGTKGYYYKQSEKDKGISCLITYGDAFGIEMGTFIYDLKQKMQSIEFSEKEITVGDLFYADYMSEGTVLTAEFDNITVQFLFEDGSLYCTALYLTDTYN